MVRRLVAVTTAAVLLLTPPAVAVPASAGGGSDYRANAAAYISVRYGKRVIRRYIKRNYTVALGPYFYGCRKPRWNKVRCDVEFKAGLFWRCGWASVRNSGGYDYIRSYTPIGC
jgi:hypothetical protein